MPTNSDSLYPYPEIKKNQLISYRKWLTNQLQKSKTTITFQTDYKENQSEIQKQSNPHWFQKSLTPSVEQEIEDLRRQIDAYLDQISDGPIREILKKTLYLLQIKDKPEKNLSLYEEKQDLCKAIFDYLIQYDPRNSKRANRLLTLSDKQIEALDLLQKIIEKSKNDNLHSLVAMWVQTYQKKQSFFECFYPKKDNLFKDHFLNKIAQALGVKKQGELAKLAKPTHFQEYENIQQLSKAQTVKPALN